MTIFQLIYEIDEKFNSRIIHLQEQIVIQKIHYLLRKIKQLASSVSVRNFVLKKLSDFCQLLLNCCSTKYFPIIDEIKSKIKELLQQICSNHTLNKQVQKEIQKEYEQYCSTQPKTNKFTKAPRKNEDEKIMNSYTEEQINQVLLNPEKGLFRSKNKCMMCTQFLNCQDKIPTKINIYIRRFCPHSWKNYLNQMNGLLSTNGTIILVLNGKEKAKAYPIDQKYLNILQKNIKEDLRESIQYQMIKVDDGFICAIEFASQIKIQSHEKFYEPCCARTYYQPTVEKEEEQDKKQSLYDNPLKRKKMMYSQKTFVVIVQNQKVKQKLSKLRRTFQNRQERIDLCLKYNQYNTNQKICYVVASLQSDTKEARKQLKAIDTFWKVTTEMKVVVKNWNVAGIIQKVLQDFLKQFKLKYDYVPQNGHSNFLNASYTFNDIEHAIFASIFFHTQIQQRVLFPTK